MKTIENMDRKIEGADLYDIMGDEIATFQLILDENIKSLESRIWSLLDQSGHMTSYGVDSNLCDTISVINAFNSNVEYICEHFKSIVNA